MAIKRYCEPYIHADLRKKMVFIGGPRQVGKTTLSKQVCQGAFASGEYFNWDVEAHRKAILQQRWLQRSPLVIFDELHKYPHWKNWIKGVYDQRPENQQYMVTGSARLDVYRRGGDSLMGRYHYWRLHPFTLDELPPGITPEAGYERLLAFGGFPEPFLMADPREARRWRRERFQRVLYEDTRDLQTIQQLGLLSLFTDALRARVGGLVTLANMAQDVEISPKTAKNWLMLLERMYVGFAIYPLTRNIPRAIQKPPKVYFYDNGDCVEDNAKRLENLVATTLLKRLDFLEDYLGHTCKLHYIRDKEGREVDFVTLIDNEVQDLIEVKSSNTEISTSLQYYSKKLKPKRTIQIVGDLKRPFDKNGVHVTHPIDFFNDPPWLKN